MKNLFKLSTFALLFCSFVFSTTGAIFADETKVEDTTVDATEVADSDKAKDSEGDKKKEKKKEKKKGEDEEEPECE